MTVHRRGNGRWDREVNDYYATEPRAVEMLLELEKFDTYIWEPACGEGHISEVLRKKWYIVESTDLIDRWYGVCVDFFRTILPFRGDIITNPPYSLWRKFVEHALSLVKEWHKVAMFLKVQFMEGKGRKQMFIMYPPKTIYVSSSRLKCAKNWDFDIWSSAVAYARYIREKGRQGDTVVRWFN